MIIFSRFIALTPGKEAKRLLQSPHMGKKKTPSGQADEPPHL
jgi:hypothetical protein